MSKEYRLIGLTGPTGSGKSAVSHIFEENGFASVDADKIAHKALCDKECIKKLTEAFGTDILSKDDTINRKALAKVAFSNKENTELLNSITHPVIIALSLNEFEDLSLKGYKNIIFDAPTLFEANMDKMCDLIISVIAPKELRLERILNRDNITEEQAYARIKAQKEDSFYTDKSNFVIVNDKDFDTLLSNTNKIIKEII
ncbi:MAG: dephospho-CoA kinase [Ruminococcaceae bacterium]|nr:dephospho-CoA kinase [Oscillospiraceae bacterium]